MLPVPRDAQPGELDVRVANISAEIAAAIAQAQSHVYEDDEEEDEEEEDDESGSGQEMRIPETIGPNTSGIRGLGDRETDFALHGTGDDDDDSDAFPMPLRTRRSKDSVSIAGTKRKR